MILIHNGSNGLDLSLFQTWAIHCCNLPGTVIFFANLKIQLANEWQFISWCSYVLNTSGDPSFVAVLIRTNLFSGSIPASCINSQNIFDNFPGSERFGFFIKRVTCSFNLSIGSAGSGFAVVFFIDRGFPFLSSLARFTGVVSRLKSMGLDGSACDDVLFWDFVGCLLASSIFCRQKCCKPSIQRISNK